MRQVDVMGTSVRLPGVPRTVVPPLPGHTNGCTLGGHIGVHIGGYWEAKKFEKVLKKMGGPGGRHARSGELGLGVGVAVVVVGTQRTRIIVGVIVVKEVLLPTNSADDAMTDTMTFHAQDHVLRATTLDEGLVDERDALVGSADGHGLVAPKAGGGAIVSPELVHPAMAWLAE